MSNFTSDPVLVSYVRRAGFSSFQEAENSTCSPPGLLQLLRQTWVSSMVIFRGWSCPVQVDAISRHVGWEHVDPVFLLLTLIFAGLLTALRCRVTPAVRNWALGKGIEAKNAAKVPESICKFVSHSVMFFASAYIVIFSGRYNFFSNPCAVWDDHSAAIASSSPMTRPLDLTLIYFIQLSYYLHSFIATIYMDCIRSDWGPMIVHHMITICLISISYSIYCLHIGVLIMFMHDFCDFVLEFTKLNSYFKHRQGKQYIVNKLLSDIGFLVFMVSWFVFRLYWYPLKVFTASSWCIFIRLGCVTNSTVAVSNIMLALLQVLHIYWFFYIAGVAIKIVTGQISEVQDTREVDTEVTPIDKPGLQPGDLEPVQNAGAFTKCYENGDAHAHVRTRETGSHRP